MHKNASIGYTFMIECLVIWQFKTDLMDIDKYKHKFISTSWKPIQQNATCLGK